MAGLPSDGAIQRETLDLAKRLIACRSITPSDGGCLDLVAARLTAAGFQCERVDRNGVHNLWARLGAMGPLVCLAGHVDVVPPGPLDAWSSDPFLAVERDGFLFGRGAADMKTAVAAMVTAAERLATAGTERAASIAVLLTSDEEGDATDGTLAVVEALQQRGATIDACIIGEPTSDARLGDTIKNGRRGSLNGVLRIKGVQRHIAYPERGANPIHQAAPALAELVATQWDMGDDDFQPTSFQVSNLAAGTGTNNVTPATLDVLFNFRFSPASPDAALRGRVHDVLDRHGLDYDLKWTSSGPPFVTRRGRLVHAIEQAIGEITGLTPHLSTSGGTSDGRFLADVAREIVEFGPVNRSIHKIDECVGVDEIASLSRIYETTIVRWLAGS